MGKKLIINNADFSLNGIISSELVFYNDYSDEVLEGNSAFASSNTFYLLSSELSRVGLIGKTVSYVKIYAHTSGTIIIGTYSGSAVSNQNSYAVTEGVNIIRLTNEITIDATHMPCFNGNGILSMWWEAGDETKGLRFGRTGTSTTYLDSYLPFSFGAIE